MDTTARDRLLDTLAEEVRALTTSDRWRSHLELQGRFHRYSFNNALLIGAQDPEATRVAGFATWKKFGRSVRKGERAIWILAPMVGRPIRDADGDERRPIHGFRPVAVFDIEQTEGEDLPRICRNLEGGDPLTGFQALCRRAERLDYRVELAELPGTTNGDCSFALRRIRVEARNHPAQQVKTLAHELAHALLHEAGGDRARAELEAESTAFVVCRAFGIDSGGYSFGYVAGWAGGGPEAVAVITSSGAAIQRAVAQILDGLDGLDGPSAATDAA